MKRALVVLGMCLLAPSASEAATCSQVTFSWEGLTRYYVLCTPSTAPSSAMGVVLDYHGGGAGSAGRYKNSGWVELVDAKKMVVVFMNGCTKTSPTSCVGPRGSFFWNFYAPDEPLTWNDVSYSTAVVDRLKSVHKLNVDTSRVYASGFSAGAVFAYTLGCRTSNLVKAIGSVSGTVIESTCPTRSRFAIYQVTGYEDQNVPYEGCRKATESCDLPVCANDINYWPHVRTGYACTFPSLGVARIAQQVDLCDIGWSKCTTEIPDAKLADCYSAKGCADKGVLMVLVNGAGHSWDDTGAALGGMASWLWTRFEATP